MNNLVIYDNNGTIFFQASGDVQTPVGLQHMIVDVPSGQTLQRIDTSTETHTPVFVDIPKSEIELLKEADAIKSGEIEMLKLLVADLALNQGGGL